MKKFLIPTLFLIIIALSFYIFKKQKAIKNSIDNIEDLIKARSKKPVEKPIAPPAPTISKKPKFQDIESDVIDKTPLNLVTQKFTLSTGEALELDLPKGYKIYPAAEGIPRVRFFAKAPDGRLFVTGMHNLTDNKKGKVYILENFDEDTKKFQKVTVWKDKLRNPNSVEFYTDENGENWLYLTVTDSLVRYPYQNGEHQPSHKPEKIADFPGDGLSYKYGGWHLTRTISFHDNKLYVSVGSSCNLCEEREDEPFRAAIAVMNPDGSNQKVYAKGIRNAVDIDWIEGKLYATNMTADHLGKMKPNDPFYEIKEGENYGWPYCYEHEQKMFDEDPENQSENRVAKKIVKNSWDRKTINCVDIPPAYSLFEAHGSPLGFAYFGEETKGTALQNYFLASLHGSTVAKVGTGHRIVRFKKGFAPEPFIDNFLKNGKRVGRPCDIYQWDEDSFFFSDDFKGVVYFVKKKS
ncbi:MAG: glucose/arabinose dehydrogenase [Paraglaciecola sp.]|jgi:glucose/arabinose dehydrogenase